MAEQLSLSVDNYIVRSYHADYKQRLSITSLFNFLQESAWHHASRNAFGFYDLLDKGYFWALTRMKVVIDTLPMWDDNLRLETWSKEPDAISAYRDFELFNEQGNIMIQASSAWLIVDIKSRRPQRIAAFKDNFPHLPNRYAIQQPPAKIAELGTSIAFEKRIICTSDIDMNGHVNNANYVRWALDALPLALLEQHNPAEIEINFLRESKAGEHYVVNTEEKNSLHYLCNIVRTEDNCELARMEIKFK